MRLAGGSTKYQSGENERKQAVQRCFLEMGTYTKGKSAKVHRAFDEALISFRFALLCFCHGPSNDCMHHDKALILLLHALPQHHSKLCPTLLEICIFSH